MLLSRTNFGKYCLLDNSPGPDHTQACKIPWNLNYGPGHCPAVRKMCERCWWGEFSSNQPQPSLRKDSCRTLLRDTLEFPPDRGGNWLDVSGFFHWLRNTAKARIQTQDCVQHSKADSFPRRFSGGHHLSPCPFSYLPHLNQSWAGMECFFHSRCQSNFQLNQKSLQNAHLSYPSVCLELTFWQCFHPRFLPFGPSSPAKVESWQHGALTPDSLPSPPSGLIWAAPPYKCANATPPLCTSMWAPGRIPAHVNKGESWIVSPSHPIVQRLEESEKGASQGSVCLWHHLPWV